MPQLLIIEDDVRIRSLLMRSLTERGHAVASAPTGMTGLSQALADHPDLVVLDLGLPDVDGLEILTMLRAVSQVPVIVATARDDEASLVRALDSGADDYVTKPFTANQLDARVRAVLRRSGDAATAASVIRVGELEIDLRARCTTMEGRSIELSPKEFDLLAYLAGRVDEVVTKRELLTDVWQLPYGGPDKTIDVHLSWLRRKLGETAEHPRYLHTVRGVGIRLVTPQ